jgi:uncharacterized membrane protein
MADLKQKYAFSAKALESLTDGVFAIVMTLLVLDLSVPLFRESQLLGQLRQLGEAWPEFACYFATFLSLGYLWFIHHRGFIFLKNSDSVIVGLNVLSLAFTSLLPFSTSLLAHNMWQKLPVLLYEGNWLVCGIIGCWIWTYMLGKNGVVDRDKDLHELRRSRTTLSIALAFIAMAMLISTLNTIASLIFFIIFFIAFASYLIRRYRLTDDVDKTR